MRIRMYKKPRKQLLLLIIVLATYLYNKDWIEEIFEINLYADKNYVPPAGEERFVMYRCDRDMDTHNCGGLADRFKGITSAYVWSILTNRSLLIKMTRPCNLVNLLLPNEVDWNRDVQVNENDKVELFKYGDNAFKERLKYMDLTLYKQATRLIVLHTNRNYAEAIEKNKQFHDTLRAHGYDPERFDLSYSFREMYGRLFKLAPKLQTQYNEFMARARPNNNTKLICAQIRIGFIKHEIRKFYYDSYFQSVSNAKRFWQFIRENITSKLDEPSNYRLFLATDNVRVYQDAVNEFGDKLVVYDGPFKHIDYVKYSDDVNDCSSVEKSILDFHTFQNCDYAVISFTQFGTMGICNRLDPITNVFRLKENLREFESITHRRNIKLS